MLRTPWLLLFYSTRRCSGHLGKMWPFWGIMGQISFKGGCRNVGHLVSGVGWVQVEAVGLCAAVGHTAALQRGNQHAPEQTPLA